MRCAKEWLRLYAVTDRRWLGDKTLAQQVEAAIKGGVTCVQLREKALDEDAFLSEALEIKAVCRRYGVPFFINDNVNVAVKSGADGVHIGQHDRDATHVRAAIGEQMLLGVSVQTVEQAVKAQACGADCLGVGAVFSTATKADADTVSLATLQAICTAVSIPVVAIGGIGRHNLQLLHGTGVAGAALVSAIFASTDIEQECRELRGLLEKM